MKILQLRKLQKYNRKQMSGVINNNKDVNYTVNLFCNIDKKN